MSDFAGIFNFDGSPISDESLSALSVCLSSSNALRPRMWRASSVGLVHVKRILSPQDAFDFQPRPFANSQHTLLFDGRLDERGGLARSLNRQFDPDRPDSAWVAEAIDRWGEGAPEKLLGDFAYAHWNEQNRILTLVRDRIGQRSLYYHLGSKFLVFSTTIRALLALPDVPRELDETGLANFLALNPFDPVRTLYRGVMRVPAAHSLMFSEGRCHPRRYWQIDPSRRLNYARDEDYTEAARELLYNATKDRLRIVGPPVVMTSGGLDSSGVAATAARITSPETVFGLTAVPPEDFQGLNKTGKYSDERSYVRALEAMHDNLRIETVSPGASEPIEDDPRSLFALTGMPMRNVHGVAWFGPAWRRAAALGASTLLTGDFGNMSLSYNGSQRLEALRAEGKWGSWAAEVGQFARIHGLSPWRMLVRQLMPPRPKPRGWAQYSSLNEAFASEINTDEHFASCGFEPGQTRLNGDYSSQLVRILEAGSLSSDGRSALRILTGLTMSDPLADTRLLEFCAALPPDQYFRRGQARWLARRVLADRVPSIIAENTRRGEQCPEWFARMDLRRDEISKDIERLESSLATSRVLDVDRLKALVKTWPSNSRAAEARVDDYRFVLARGVHVGQFIRWAEGTND